MQSKGSLRWRIQAPPNEQFLLVGALGIVNPEPALRFESVFDYEQVLVANCGHAMASALIDGIPQKVVDTVCSRVEAAAELLAGFARGNDARVRGWRAH